MPHLSRCTPGPGGAVHFQLRQRLKNMKCTSRVSRVSIFFGGENFLAAYRCLVYVFHLFVQRFQESFPILDHRIWKLGEIHRNHAILGQNYNTLSAHMGPWSSLMSFVLACWAKHEHCAFKKRHVLHQQKQYTLEIIGMLPQAVTLNIPAFTIFGFRASILTFTLINCWVRRMMGIWSGHVIQSWKFSGKIWVLHLWMPHLLVIWSGTHHPHGCSSFASHAPHHIKHSNVARLRFGERLSPQTQRESCEEWKSSIWAN